MGGVDGGGGCRCRGVQLSCRHVQIDKVIIHDDNPNQEYFGGWGLKWGQSRGRGRRAEQ